MVHPAAGNLKTHLVLVGEAIAGPDLSDREREVFERLRRGLGRKAIARELGVTPGCIAGYSRSMYRKLGIRCTEANAMESDPPPQSTHAPSSTSISLQANILLP